LQAALTHAAINNNGNPVTIQIAQGYYLGNFTYLPSGNNTGDINISGGWTADFSSQSIDPTNTILDGNNDGRVLTLKFNDIENPNIINGDIHVEGITLKNGTAPIGGGLLAFTAPPNRIDIINCIIENNISEDDAGGCSIGIYDFTSEAGGELYLSNNIIRNNEVISNYLNEGSGGGCTIFSTELTVVTNNLIYGNSVGDSNNIHSDGGGIDINILAGDLYLINNTITENIVYGGDGSGGGVSISTKPPGNGDLLSWAPGIARLYNNIIFNNNVPNGGYGDDIANKVRSANEAIGSMIIVNNNNYFSLWSGNDSVTPTLTNNITFDPELSDLYKPIFSSPIVDTALSSVPYLPSKDLQGNERTINGNTDIGCYEYDSANIDDDHLTQTQASQLYVSIFGRASEREGNVYWRTTQDNMAAAAGGMLSSLAAQSYFGATLYDNQAFIEFIYENTLGKTYAEDPEGIDYWVNKLANGETKGQIVATLIDAAMDPVWTGLPSQNRFINKVTVCNYTADMIQTCPDINDLSAFVGFIKNVTDDPTTVDPAKNLIDAF